MRFKLSFLLTLIAAMCALTPEVAHAYIGPGAGMSAIGAFLALLAGRGIPTRFL